MKFDNTDQTLIEILKLIFNLALSEFNNQVYKLRDPNQIENASLFKDIKRDFCAMGLIEFIDNK